MDKLDIVFKSETEVELVLERDGETLDMLMVPIDFHFDSMLVTSVDKILKRNRIETSSHLLVKVRGDIDQSRVAYHIASAVAASFENVGNMR